MTRTQVLRWAVLFGVAAALRLAWVGCAAYLNGAVLGYPDESLHWQLATNLIQRGALVADDGRYAARMPLYPLFLAMFAGLGGGGIIAARLAQALVGGLSCVIAARLAGRAWGARATVPVFLLTAFDPFAIFFANLLLTETVFTVLLIAFVASTWRLVQSSRGWADAFSVALLGAALVVTRPSAIALLPLMWVAVVALADDRRLASQRIVIAPFILVLALLPWGLRNMSLLGSFAWLSTNGGVTLYDAQGPQADGSSNQAFLNEMPELAALGEVERDKRLRELAVERMRADPGHVLRLAGVKLARTWSPFPNVAEHRSGAAAWAGGLYTVLLYAIVLGALVLARRRGALARLVILLGPCLYFALLHAVYIGSVRYRLPVMPLVAVFGAGAVTRTTRSAPASQ